MQNHLIKQGLLTAICLLPFLMAQNSMAENRVPFSKEKPIEIECVSEISWEKGSVEIVEGREPETLRVKVIPKREKDWRRIQMERIPTVDGMFCIGGAKIITIAPDLKAPLDPLFIDLQLKGNDLKIKEVIDKEGNHWFEFTIPEGVKYGKQKDEGFIIAGPDGATLSKKGKAFLLVEGEAYLVQAARDNRIIITGTLVRKDGSPVTHASLTLFPYDPSTGKISSVYGSNGKYLNPTCKVVEEGQFKLELDPDLFPDAKGFIIGMRPDQDPFGRKQSYMQNNKGNLLFFTPVKDLDLGTIPVR